MDIALDNFNIDSMKITEAQGKTEPQDLNEIIIKKENI